MFVVIGVGLTTVMTLRFVTGSGNWVVNPVLGILAFYGFLSLWTGFAWRMYRTGIYVSDKAVRIVHPWRNRVVAWSDVAQISSQPAMLGGWATVRVAIFLRLTNGTKVETPVQRHASRFAGGLRKNIGPVLSQADFDATLSLLRATRERASSLRP
ncbi:MAG TPA: hypothetical protein VF062_17910 [Candidatus Limnocylindrales bacterium]